MRLLIVEDHGLIAGALLERICAQRSLQTHARVRTLAEAEALLAQQTVDLIFLDLVLPDAFGLGALRALRQLQPAARVVIYSGEADPQIARDAAECSAFAFIPTELSVNS
jgi:DNA-binding NarL/FixJ family response regulator